MGTSIASVTAPTQHRDRRWPRRVYAAGSEPDPRFTFANELPNDAAYAVTVVTQPSHPTQTCTVANGSGRVNGAAPEITVNCQYAGATYALGGGMQKIADKTFLLTPRNVEVSAEEKARLVEKGFFNQS